MESALEVRIAKAKEIVEKQVAYFTEAFGAVASNWKSDGSRVTEADLHLSRTFEDAIRAAFPQDQYFSEELDNGGESIAVNPGFSWMLDPIDGTNNFARGIPTCSISLGLLKDGIPVYGFIYDNATGKLLHGGQGKGLFVGDIAWTPRQEKLSKNSIISVQCNSGKQAILDESALQARFKMRAFGSSAIHIAYAAFGWTDGAIAHRVKSWDIAAGVAMFSAVGGCTRFFNTEVFPIKSFSTECKSFGHISGKAEMCDAIEEAIGRSCRYSI